MNSIKYFISLLIYYLKMTDSKQKKIIKYPPKFDTPFKNLFKTEDNKNLLIDFLNEILYYEKKKSNKNNENENVFDDESGISYYENSNSDEEEYIPIVDVQFLDTKIPAKEDTDASKEDTDAFIIEKLEDSDTDEKEEILKKFNDIDNNDLVDGSKKRKEKKKNNDDKRKKLRRDYFEVKTPRLDSLINVIRQNYVDEIKNRKTVLELKNYNTIQFVAITRTNELIYIEIQLQNTDNVFKETLFYASDMVTHSLKNETMYNTLPKIIMINILHFNVFNDKEHFKRYFSLKDDILNKEGGFKGLLYFHFVELPKYEKLQEEEKMDEKNLWLLFLVDPNNEIFTKDGAPSKFTQARQVLLSLEEKNTAYMDKCDKEMRGYNEYLKGRKYREEIGRKKGIEIGIEIGMKKGIRISKIEIALQMLKENNKIEKIKKLTKFNSFEILEIKKLLNKPDDTAIRESAEKLEIDFDSLKKIYEVND
ncbi:hypothetical protein BCR32DRAFT_270243 [Anaeromyces robustus]|uniref:Rpn family recombination-promoting nuclease/putative transposase n=1 Tax=Anaeromyces robustus TaxID=1754192 RepID=A0A1Y1WX45_9FUNG|nr:hypothetical protein BCR32DRAFT_270243 [Anaeromyces robustus]|eukprot:ORX78127.1 hypothetical protein BCR32DRAFT_270243 [Anaeromyces robustus]